MSRSLAKIALLLYAVLLAAEPAMALTANKIWMEFRPSGRYRIYVNYTVPALREMREVFVEFNKKKEAEKFYFDVLRGADFYYPDASERSFENKKPLRPEPW